MPDLKVDIITFNDYEGAAVQQLFDDILQPGSTWAREGGEKIRLPNPEIVLRHLPLRAQGNVLAAARLAEVFSDETSRPDYIVFYGCAGAVDSGLLGEAFLVGSVSYASLGTVEAAPAGGAVPERVTLKNKWLCDTHPREVEPLELVTFESVLGDSVLDLKAATSLTAAHAVATDKVIRVSASPPPVPAHRGPPRRLYPKRYWTYGEALGFANEQSGGSPVLVEMESYGIGMIAKALKITDRVVIIRIVTDDLVGKDDASDQVQYDLLMEGRIALARLLLGIVTAQVEQDQ